jgi:hypothetical protein
MALVTIELLDSWPFGHRIDKLSSSAPGQSLPKWDIRATSVFRATRQAYTYRLAIRRWPAGSRAPHPGWQGQP